MIKKGIKKDKHQFFPGYFLMLALIFPGFRALEVVRTIFAVGGIFFRGDFRIGFLRTSGSRWG